MSASDDEIPVLLLSGRMDPRGSSAYTVRLTQRLAKHGIRPMLVCQSADCIPPGERAPLSIRERPHLDLPILGRFVFRDLLADLRAEPPALVHVQTPASLRWGQQIAAALRLPLVLTIHNFLPAESRFRFQPPLDGRVIAVSEPVKADLVRRFHVTPHKVQMIHSGVDVEEAPAPPVEPAPPRERKPWERPSWFEKPAASEPPPPKVNVVGAAGPLEPEKGQEYFLRAARKILDRGLDVEFLVAGRGPDEARLRRLADELRLTPHLTFVPYVQRYRDVLAAIDVFCLPSLQQGLGTVMLEAMSLGKPVVATDVGGVSAAVRDGKTGLVVPSHDADALADRLVAVLTDPDLAARIGAAGRDLVRESFDAEQMALETANLYREVLSRPVTLRLVSG
jgi:glycosyltransferase involved in cell wall biosynthesis